MTDTIVVGIDDSDGARTALAWAMREAEKTGARLRVVHAYQLDLAWIDVNNEAIPQWEAHARSVAEETLARVAHEVIPDRRDDVELDVVEGSPGEVLHEAGADASLVVVGSRGRGGFAGLLLGSVSQRLAQRAPCPVVIVPPLPDASGAAARS